MVGPGIGFAKTVVARQSGTEGIAAREQGETRRSAHRHRKAVIEMGSAFGKSVDVGVLNLSAPVKLVSPSPTSSAKMKMMFGCDGGTFDSTIPEHMLRDMTSSRDVMVRFMKVVDGYIIRVE